MCNYLVFQIPDLYDNIHACPKEAALRHIEIAHGHEAWLCDASASKSNINYAANEFKSTKLLYRRQHKLCVFRC